VDGLPQVGLFKVKKLKIKLSYGTEGVGSNPRSKIATKITIQP